MKAGVAAFNQEKALVGAFSVITNLRMELFQALVWSDFTASLLPPPADCSVLIPTQFAPGRCWSAGQAPACQVADRDSWATGALGPGRN